MKVLRKQRRDASPNVKAETSDHRAPSACSPRVTLSLSSPLLFFFHPVASRGSKLFRGDAFAVCLCVLTTEYRRGAYAPTG